MNDENESPVLKPENPHFSLLKKFAQDVIASLTEPRIFFSQRYPKISFSHALAFGVSVNWLADFLNWLTRMVRHETLLDGLLKMRHQLEALPFWKDLPTNLWAQVPDHSYLFPSWLTEISSVVLSPFQSLFKLIISGIILWLGALILIPKNHHSDRIELTQTIKMAALCSAPHLFGAILGFLPFGLGSFFSSIYSVVLIVFALSLRFHISKLRSLGVLILPGMLLSVIGTCFLGLILVLFFGSIAAIFGGM